MVLASTPDIDGTTRAHRGTAEEWLKGDVTEERGVALPVRRIGLEQEFFLVDRTGVLCDLADHFLRRCWEAAGAEGLDPTSFKPECVKSLVEITTPPSSGIEGLVRNYLGNLNLALDVASELGLELYPLGTYPLAIRPEVRDEAGYGCRSAP
jgi:gamma-glutamyl:cysteine ligase YbdK (ATP-grasp superfamily)